MKRRKFLLYWATLQSGIIIIAFVTLLIAQSTETAIVPPPWSDPDKNPCATLPGGWQLLYWPPLNKCFKIFTIGYPCPDTMELSPAAISGKFKQSSRMTPTAECRCPPGTALNAETNKCHVLFQRGPCQLGLYFSPAAMQENDQRLSKRIGNRLGSCRVPRLCPENMIFWPQDGKCYTKYTKGPCIRGKLLVLNEDGLGECMCNAYDDVLRNYYYDEDETCHEHYTKGPCSTLGHLFLPGAVCDCTKDLPHYYPEHQMCFELNSPGPCALGHVFTIPENKTLSSDNIQTFTYAKCQCKDGYVLWSNGNCYRLYTRGPCDLNEFLINSTSCMTNTCGKGRLYFPDQKSCYRIGAQGPCALNQVVVFDFTARPSIDGISYNGICGCAGIIMNLDQQCGNAVDNPEINTCESTPGMVELSGNCYKLYSRGPCGPGQWLEPLKTQIDSIKQRRTSHKAKCVCRPGYTESDQTADTDGNGGGSGIIIRTCNAPSVGLARYLTTHQRQNHKFSSNNYYFPSFQLITTV